MFLEDRGSARQRCRVRSTWRLFLRLRDKKGLERTLSTHLEVCNRHRSSITAEQVLDSKTWEDVLRQTLLKWGFRPKKSKTQLKYERCSHAELGK